MQPLDLKLLERIKKLAILAMVSDDELLELFVFKGGSAIDLFYGQGSSRASLDLDFSMEGALTKAEEQQVGKKIKTALQKVFKEDGLYVFDIHFEPRPKNGLPDKIKDFWGGYQVIFKAIEITKKETLGDDIEAHRRNAYPVGEKMRTKFKIDISSHEYCQPSQPMDFKDYTIYVYTPEMIVFEKLRAICQQIPDYQKIVQTNQKPRGRDFYDIEFLMKQHPIDVNSEENKTLIRNIFEIKQVPLDYIQQIKDQREFHRENFDSSLKNTVKETPKDFDYYFEFVLERFEGLKF